MAYITTTQLSARLGSTLYARLTDRVNGTTADNAVAQQIIDEVEAEADSYFAQRYGSLAAHMRVFYDTLEKMLANVHELKYGLARRLERGEEELFPTPELRSGLPF